MSDALVVLVVLAGGTYVLKSAGPLVLGGRRLPSSLQTLVDLLPAALLASLTLVSTFSDGEQLVMDARVVGLAVAKQAVTDGVATSTDVDALEERLNAYRWEPRYPEVLRAGD